jgi:hypothetical protein
MSIPVVVVLKEENVYLSQPCGIQTNFWISQFAVFLVGLHSQQLNSYLIVHSLLKSKRKLLVVVNGQTLQNRTKHTADLIRFNGINLLTPFCKLDYFTSRRYFLLLLSKDIAYKKRK